MGHFSEDYDQEYDRDERYRSADMIGLVESVAPSKSGKAFRVKLSGSFYNAFLDSGLDKVVGKSIDCQITPDKGFGLGIGQWSLAEGQPPTKPSTASPAGFKQMSGTLTVAIPQDRFYMPFVSNVVAHAIAAGQIKTPADLNQWAKAAYEAAQALDAL